MTTESVDELADKLFEELEVELDEFHAHESLDRMFLITDMFSAYVREHPYVAQNKELADKAEELGDAMYTFYNTLANHIWDNESKG